jgi:hypothetical protein
VSAVLLILLAALLAALLLLTGLLLSALLAALLLLTGLLLSALLAALLLAALLLLARFLIRILIHHSVLSNFPILTRSATSIARAPTEDNAPLKYLFRSNPRSTLKKMCLEPRCRTTSSRNTTRRIERWDVIYCCGFLECRFRFLF